MISGLLSASVRTGKIPQLESWVFYVVMEMIASIDGDFLPRAPVVPRV